MLKLKLAGFRAETEACGFYAETEACGGRAKVNGREATNGAESEEF